MKSILRIGVVVAAVVLLASTSGYSQNRPQCFDVDGIPISHGPEGCFFPYEPGTPSGGFDFDGELLILLSEEGNDWAKLKKDGSWFVHLKDKEAKAFFCNPTFNPGCEGRLDDLSAPDFAFEGELIGTARVTFNTKCIGDDVVTCVFTCPLMGMIAGEVFDQQGNPFTLTGAFIAPPSADNPDRCKLMMFDFGVE